MDWYFWQNVLTTVALIAWAVLVVWVFGLRRGK
jgi:hypothetical protein